MSTRFFTNTNEQITHLPIHSFTHLPIHEIAPLQLSRELYKSALFMQNKPNFLESQNERKLCLHSGL
jgi:hypothetical protein